MDRAVKALQNHWAEKNSRRKAPNPSHIRRKFDQQVTTAA
jgi:hypothetical protein